MTDGYGFTFGDYTSPLTASTADSLFGDSDLLTKQLLEHLRDVINLNIGDRFRAELAKHSITLPDSASDPISEIVPYDPKDYPLEQTFRLPLLSLYRTTSKVHQFTFSDWGTRERWTLEYILPPLSSLGFAKIGRFPIIVRDEILFAICRGTHPEVNGGLSFRDGTNMGDIRLLDEDFQSYRFQAGDRGEPDQVYPAYTLTLEVDVHAALTSGNYSDLESWDGYVDGYADPFATATQWVEVETEGEF